MSETLWAGAVFAAGALVTAATAVMILQGHRTTQRSNATERS